MFIYTGHTPYAVTYFWMSLTYFLVLLILHFLTYEGSEEESQVGLVVPEDVRPSEAETMILPRTPDESLVVDVARGLDSGSMIEQAHSVLMHVSYSHGRLPQGGGQCGGLCMVVCAILSVGPRFQGPALGWYAGLGVRMRPNASCQYHSCKVGIF